MYVHDGLDGWKGGLIGWKHGGIEVNRCRRVSIARFYVYTSCRSSEVNGVKSIRGEIVARSRVWRGDYAARKLYVIYVHTRAC